MRWRLRLIRLAAWSLRAWLTRHPNPARWRRRYVALGDLERHMLAEVERAMDLGQFGQ